MHSPNKITMKKGGQTYGAAKSTGHTLVQAYEELSDGSTEVTFKFEYTIPVSDLSAFDEDQSINGMLDYGEVVCTGLKE